MNIQLILNTSFGRIWLACHRKGGKLINATPLSQFYGKAHKENYEKVPKRQHPQA
jgi:hypothetical protein